jgi:hypothetical protein
MLSLLLDEIQSLCDFATRIKVRKTPKSEPFADLIP